MGSMINIDYNAYEAQHNPGFLAYITEGKQILEDDVDAEGLHKGALWFDNTILDADGTGIILDKDNKTFSIQEYDGKDPNISGGTDFMVAFRTSFSGLAVNGGYVRIMIANSEANLNDPDTIYMKDVRGNLLAAEKYYKKDDELGALEIVGVINATGVKKFKCGVITNIPELYLSDKERGLTGVMIQSFSSTEKTGLALTQYELDTQQDINFSGIFLGNDRVNLAYVMSKDFAKKVIPQGTLVTEPDGWGFYSLSASTHFGITSSHLDIDGDFNLHKVFSADETLALHNKEIRASLTIDDEQTGYILALVKWTGKPDEYTHEIFKSRNQLAPNFEANWEKVDQLIINPLVIVGDHHVEKVFTIPKTANNYALVLYPESDLGNATVKLKQFKVDVVNPFNAYYIHSTNPIKETHLELDTEYRQLIQDTQGYGALRYTINNAPMPMPVGMLGKGANLDITIDPTVNVIHGSAAKGGEGAIKFGREGIATINTQLRVWSEQSQDYNVQFWYSKVSSDGQTFTKIIDSDLTQLVKKHASNTLLTMPGFEIDVKPGDRIALFAQSDIVDGAFIECVSDDKPMVKTDIRLEIVTAGSGDVPGTGVDLSGFTKVYDYQDIVRYDFSNTVQIEIPLEIPADVEMAVLSVHKQDSDGKVRPIKDPDYEYDPVGHTLKFHFGVTPLTGQVVLGFYV